MGHTFLHLILALLMLFVIRGQWGVHIFTFNFRFTYVICYRRQWGVHFFTFNFRFTNVICYKEGSGAYIFYI